MSGERERLRSTRPWLLVTSLAALALVVGALGYWAWRAQADGLEAAAKASLTSLADDRAREIRGWLDERLGDARAVTGNPLFTAAMAERLSGRDSVDFRRGVEPLLRRIQRSHGYPAIALVGPSGVPVWGLPQTPGALDAVSRSLVRRAKAVDTPLVSKIYLTPEGRPGMAMVAPLFTRSGVPAAYVGSLVFAIDPSLTLHSLLARDSAGTRSGETLLVERRGSRVVFLSDPRFGERKALLFSLPIDTPDLPAAVALTGAPAVSEGIDYRGVEVWFTGRPVPGTSWFVVAKIDAGEVLAPVRTRAWLIAGLTVAIVLLAGAAFLAFWRLREARVEAALHKSELERRALVRRYDLLAEYANDMIVLFDDARVLIDVNQRACEVYGYAREELLGLSLRDLLASEQHEPSAARWTQIEASGGLTFLSRHQRKDGSEFPIEVSARVIDIEGVRFVHAIARDITDRKRAEEALRESERRYRFLTENVSDVIWVLDADEQRMTYISPSVEALTGFSPAEACSRRMDELLTPRSADHVAAVLPERIRAFRSGSDIAYLDELEQLRGDGSTVWTETTTRFVVNAESGHLEALGASRDISARRQAEEESRLVVEFLALINQSQGVRELVHNAVTFVRAGSGCEAVGIRLRDGDDYPYIETSGFPAFVEAENRLCAVDPSGKPLKDDELDPVLDCMCGAVISGHTDPSQPFFTEGGSFWTDSTTRRLSTTGTADGQARTRNRCHGEGYESVALIPLRVGDGCLGLLQLNDHATGRFSLDEIRRWEHMAGHLAVALAKLRAEEALRENTERLLRAQQLADMGDWDWDVDSGTVTWSDEVYPIFGVDRSFTTTFATIVPMIHPDDRPANEAAVRRLLANADDMELEFRVVRPNGEVRHLHQTVTVERRDDGTAERAFGILQDVTERRADEEQIRLLNAELEQRVEDRTAQLEAANKELEAFSYSVSHDLRAPLRAIDGFSLALLEDYGEILDATGRDYLGRVRAASQRMGLLIDDLLRLSRVSRDSMTPRRIDLSKLARATIADLRANEPERAVEVLIEPHVLCTADRRLLGIALDNLLGNAWKFTAGTPDARIEFGVIADDGAPQAYFVRDNGAGFDGAYAGGLFQPFQRLHRSDEYPGSGIGLAIVNRVVTRHGGRVWAEGEVGGGATFYFTVGGGALSDR